MAYRLWAQEQANFLKLEGWVRNRRADRSVEACITGEDVDVNRFVSACYKGPSAAKVTAIEALDGVDENTGKFEIRETV